MIFDNVYPVLTLEKELGELAGCPVSRIPFMDCQECTNYYISRDGRNVFVGIHFNDYAQIKRVKITEAGKRSPSSAPCFKRRNKNGSQSWASVPVAVYGAFVLHDRMPNFKLRHMDGNIDNNDIANLSLADGSNLCSNMRILSAVYSRFYCRLIHMCKWFRPMREEQAEDYVSEAFMRLCLSNNEIRQTTAHKLWWFMIKESILTFRARNKTTYEVYDLIENRMSGMAEPDSDAECRTVWEAIPKDCIPVVRMVMEGYSQYEIGNELGISQAWVSKLLYKTRKALSNDK